LQGRLFSYSDTHRHRLGPNHLQIPVNAPRNAKNRGNYQRDGLMTVTDNQGGAPNYFPNSFNGPQESNLSEHRESVFSASGDVTRYHRLKM
jgi:catalase